MTIPIKTAKEQGWIITEDNPQQIIGHTKSNMMFLREIHRYLGCTTEPTILEYTDFETEFAKQYQDQHQDNIAQTHTLMEMAQELDSVETENQDDVNAPTVQYINSIIQQANTLHASDIHLEVFSTFMCVRFRIDGVLQEIIRLDSKVALLLVARLKIMSSLDVAERRLPQDGRITFKIGTTFIDMRVSTLPTGDGERIVLRLLEKNTAHLNFDTLGMNAETQQEYKRILQKQNGLILVAGPTGAGKTTSLYTGMISINTPDKNIMTIEDPIEYNIDGINQTQIHQAIDMTFSRGLRAILRQDPDVILIGEIRDNETAQIAIQSGLTGHLVLSTVHANSAIATITRMLDIGIEPYLLASTLQGVMAQRLVRKLCSCKEKRDISPIERSALFNKDLEYSYHPMGCEKCAKTGYKGRVGIFELCLMSDTLASALSAGESEQTLYQKATFVQTLQESASLLIEKGQTPISEIMRVMGD